MNKLEDKKNNNLNDDIITNKNPNPKYEIEDNKHLYIEDINTERKPKYSLKEEIIRVINFYKEQPSIIIIILFISYLLYSSIGIDFSKNSNIKKNSMIGGEYEEKMESMKSSIFELFISTKLFNNLKEKFNYDKGILNKITVIFGYIFLGFIVRPIKGFFFVIIILIGISGSFIFPFLIFGIMLYHVFKKVLFNKKPKLD